MTRMPASESREENHAMRKLTVLVAVLVIGACDKSKPELDKTLAQMQQISAEKDSLLKDVMQTSQFIADVNTQLATVKSLNAGKPVKGAAATAETGKTPAEQRDAIKVKIKSEGRCRWNSRRARSVAPPPSGARSRGDYRDRRWWERCWTTSSRPRRRRRSRNRRSARRVARRWQWPRFPRRHCR